MTFTKGLTNISVIWLNIYASGDMAARGPSSWGVASRIRSGDSAGELFADFVAQKVYGAINESHLSVRRVAELSGINRTTLQDRINNVRPFTTVELGCVAVALGVHPSSFVQGFEP